MTERIFIGSVRKELAEERRAIRDYLRGDPLLHRFFDVFLFEDLPASDRRADDVYLKEVGELPPALTIAQLRRPHACIPRNPLIAEPMFLARYAEKAGSGILNMIARFRKAGLPTPQFRQEGGKLIQTLPRPTPQVAPEVAQQVEAAVSDRAVLWANALRAMLLAASDVTGQVAAEILTFFQEPETGKDIQDAIGLRHRETFLDNYLNPLIQSVMLERTIPDKPTSRFQKYRLTEKGRAWLAAQQHPK